MKEEKMLVKIRNNILWMYNESFLQYFCCKLPFSATFSTRDLKILPKYASKYRRN